MGKRIAICLLVGLLLVAVSAQGYEYYRYGTYIGLDDIDNDMFLFPYDEPGMYMIQLYLGDTGRSIEGSAVQYGSTLSFKANYAGSQPRYTGTIEEIGDNQYRVTLMDSYSPGRRETFLYCWVSE